MNATLETLKGLHPGPFLERELKKRGISKSRLALDVGEYPQTLVAIIKGRRKLNTSLAFRIEKKLGLEEGLLMMLQVFYEIAEEKKRLQGTPDTGKFSKSLFWDTNVDSIDWIKHKRWVIKRAFERGDDQDKAEIVRFYGHETVDAVLHGF